ncbi:outer membrane protein [Kaistia terrae]|uniref:Outer membrane protein n=1 Tax=Kaistia terrae TaxID=537017 RepID=A0ABW0Q1X3_9HYPH|nr:outer membrane beta-barrel protein [Kaistia terrae]MCX5581738.1 outer membrane beta-barrel protein [Kaistia terrae]
MTNAIIYSLAFVPTLLFAAGAAQAADLTTAPAPVEEMAPEPTLTWSGLYIGGDLGWGQTSTSYAVTAPGGGSSLSSTNRDGVLGGLFVGYNWQFDKVVLGAEVDASFLTTGEERFTAFTGDFVTARTNWVGSARGRLGYAMDRGLFYVTGGLAFASSEVKVPLTGISVDAGDSARWGGTVGVGAEYALSSHWITGVEYRYTRYESSTPNIPGDINISQDLDTNQITARLAYKF